jgi:WD40 repeat protein
VAYFTLALSPDGALLAAADYKSGNIDIWGLPSGVHRKELRNEGPIPAMPVIQFSYDGRWFAALLNGGVCIFDLQTWEKKLWIAGPEIVALSFDPGTSRLATASSLGDVSIWDIATGDRQLHLRERGDRLNQLAFSLNGLYLAAAGQDGVDRVWNARSGELQVEFKNHKSPTIWVEFGSNSNLLVSSDIDGIVTTSDVVLKVAMATFDASTRLAHAVHFDPSARRVIGASFDGKAHIWDVASSYLQWASPPVQPRCLNGIPPDADRRYLAVACDDHRTRVWDTARDLLLAELPGPFLTEHDQAAVASPVVSVDGRLAAIAAKDRVNIHGLPNGRVLHIADHSSAVTAAAFSATSDDLVSGSSDGTLLVTRDDGGQFQFARAEASVDAIAWLANDRIVVADASPRLAIYDAVRRTKLAEHALQARTMAFRSSADGRHLLLIPVTGSTQPAELWDVEQSRSIARLDSHAMIYAARFVADDRQILTASVDGSARLWDALTGRLRKTFLHASSILFDAALDPTGTLVVTAGADGVLGFWDLASSRLLWTMRTHGSQLTGIHFENGALVTRSSHGEVGRWSLASPIDPMRAAERTRGCFPIRFDTETDGLIEQTSSCDLH